MRKKLCLVLVLLLIFSSFSACSSDTSSPIVHSESENTYLRPLDLEFEFLNSAPTSNHWLEVSKVLNGFAQKDFYLFYSILESSESYQEFSLERKQSRNESITENKEKYGDNFKFSYSLINVEELNESQISEYQAEINKDAEDWEKVIRILEDPSSKYWSYCEYTGGLTETERSRLLTAMNGILNEFRNARITQGYTLSYTHITSGDLLTTPLETAATKSVCCIDGNWVDIDLVVGNLGYSVTSFALYAMFYNPLYRYSTY